MITSIGTVSVYVRDQEKAVKFYTDKLGFEVPRNEPMGPNARWIELVPKGSQTRIVPFTPPGWRTASALFRESYSAAMMRKRPTRN